MSLPEKYRWLTKEKPSPMGAVALSFFGLKETAGPANNATIMAWAKEVGGPIAGWYDEDAKAWCGLFMAVCAKRAGLPVPKGFDSIRAKMWAKWGVTADKPALWDVLVFNRDGGGHVGLYVGEDAQAYHVLGGNQSDMVCVTRIAKDRLLAARHPVVLAYDRRQVVLNSSGNLSQNEA